MPVGGYADVTTRGKPDQILPSQFALEDLEFVRRFAENELLFYRREEPPVREREDLVVLLDQGVRTWGDVRLVLASATLALARQAGRRDIPFLLATTSGRGVPFDPLRVEEATVARGSRRATCPTIRACARTSPGGTGARTARCRLADAPANLREADVCAAACRLGPKMRLFAVTVDAEGHAELCEVRRGAAVRLREVRIGVNDPARPAMHVPLANADSSAWRGDVEPIGFPFRFGLAGPIGKDLFDFDEHGEWLLTASRHGMLHAWRTDGEGMEILPRAYHEGAVLTDIRAVLGVTGGFVVIGFLKKRVLGIHYDFTRRNAAIYVLGDTDARDREWYYSAEHHVLAAPSRNWDGGCAIDLANGGRYQPNLGGPPRAVAGWETLRRGRLPGRWIGIATSGPTGQNRVSTTVTLDPYGGLLVQNADSEWRHFLPQEDGQCILRNGQLLQAQGRANVVALKVSDSRNGKVTLKLYRGPDGVSLWDMPIRREQGFVLSKDGRKLARMIGRHQLLVQDVFHPSLPPLRTRVGGFSSTLGLAQDESWLVLGKGKQQVTFFNWSGKQLQVHHSKEPSPPEKAKTFGERPGSWAKKGLSPEETYDPERFCYAVSNALLVIADRFGQVAILDREEKLICMFFVFRNQFGAWMPDGTRCGSASIIGARPRPMPWKGSAAPCARPANAEEVQNEGSLPTSSPPGDRAGHCSFPALARRRGFASRLRADRR